MGQTKARLNRRNFLLALGAGGAATAVAVVAKNPASGGAAAAAAGSDKRATKGYTASEHTNNYYRTTKV